MVTPTILAKAKLDAMDIKIASVLGSDRSFSDRCLGTLLLINSKQRIALHRLLAMAQKKDGKKQDPIERRLQKLRLCLPPSHKYVRMSNLPPVPDAADGMQAFLFAERGRHARYRILYLKEDDALINEESHC